MAHHDSAVKPSQSVIAAMAILEAFDRTKDEMTLAQISQTLGFAKSSTLRHLKALSQSGYLIYEPERKVYALGPAVLSLAQRFISQRAPIMMFRPFLFEVAEETHETAHFGILNEIEVIYLDIAESAQRIRAYVERGDRLAAHVTASGKAILANSPQHTVEDFIDRWVASPDAPSPMRVERFRHELEATKQRGYGINLDEWMKDVSATSAPVFAPSGKVIGAVGIAGPSSRINSNSIDEKGAIVLKKAAKMSNALCASAA